MLRHHEIKAQAPQIVEPKDEHGVKRLSIEYPPLPSLRKNHMKKAVWRDLHGRLKVEGQGFNVNSREDSERMQKRSPVHHLESSPHHGSDDSPRRGS